MSTFCILAQGGGMVTAYHAGVVRGLNDRFGFDNLGRVVASSGAAAIYAYLASGQQSFIIPIWQSLVRSKRFVTPWRHLTGRGVMEIDFLVDEMIKRIFPLDVKALCLSSVHLDIGVTETATGKSRFFSHQDVEDFHELIRATCAVPYFYGKSVALSGVKYCDGTIGDVLGLEQVQDERHILIVLTRPFRSLPQMIFIRKILRWLLLRNELLALQEAIWSMPTRYERVHQDIQRLMQEKNIAVICPPADLPMYRIDTSVARLERTIELGYRDVMEHKGLVKFFTRVSEE